MPTYGNLGMQAGWHAAAVGNTSPSVMQLRFSSPAIGEAQVLVKKMEMDPRVPRRVRDGSMMAVLTWR